MKACRDGQYKRSKIWKIEGLVSTVSTIRKGVHLVFKMFYSNHRAEYGRRKALYQQCRHKPLLCSLSPMVQYQYQISVVSTIQKGVHPVFEMFYSNHRADYGRQKAFQIQKAPEATLWRVFTPHSNLYKVLCKSHKHQCRQT